VPFNKEGEIDLFEDKNMLKIKPSLFYMLLSKAKNVDGKLRIFYFLSLYDWVRHITRLKRTFHVQARYILQAPQRKYFKNPIESFIP
jgi:hypothetical protein